MLDLTLERMRHIRLTIWRRRYEDEQRRLRVEEIKLQTLAGSIHAASGNTAGVKGAWAIRLTDDAQQENLPSTEATATMFGPVNPDDLIEIGGGVSDG